MAIAAVTQRGTLNSADLGTSASLSITSPTTVTVGNTLIMTIAVDNAGLAGATVFPQVDDPRNNSWRLVQGVNRDPGALDEGVQVFILSSVIEEKYVAADALLISFYLPSATDPSVPVNMDRGVINVFEFSGVAWPSASWAGSSSQGSGTAAATGPFSPLATGQLVIGAAAVETNAALTGDADVVNGPWVTTINAASNSGVAATSVSLISQYKIVTGTSAQTWDVTWAGAADYAATAVTLDVYVAPAAEPFPRDNPNYPDYAGPETLAIADAVLPIDPSTGIVVAGYLNYGYNNSADMASFSTWKIPNERNNVIVAHDLYLNPADIEAGLNLKPVTLELPLRNATTSGAVTIVGGGTALQALQHPGSDRYLQMDASVSAGIRLFFDTTQLGYFPSHRILRVGLKFLGWKDDSSPAIPGEGFDVYGEDTLAHYGQYEYALYGSWLTPDYKVNAKMQTRWLGETNLTQRVSTSYFTGQVADSVKYPWTQADLAHMNAGDESFYFSMFGAPGYDLLQTAVFLDYVVLVVELVPEFRSMVAHRILSNLSFSKYTTDNAGNFSYGGNYAAEFRQALDTTSRGRLAAGPTTPPVYLMVRQALPASPSDRFRVAPDGNFEFTRAESFGPSPMLEAAATLRNPDTNVQDLARVPLDRGVPLSGSVGLPNYVTSVTLTDPGYDSLVGPSFIATKGESPYLLQYVAGVSPANVKISVTGARTYDHIHVLVKNQGSDDPLLFSVQQPVGSEIATASLSQAAWDAAPEAGEGWKEINVPLSIPITPIPGTVFINATSPGTPAAAAWLISSYETTNFGVNGYEWNVTADVVGAQWGGVPWVSLMALSAVMDDPEYLLGSTSTQGDLGHLTQVCLNDLVLDVPYMDIVNGASYDWVSIERTSDGGQNWAPVILLENPIDMHPVYDYEVPWDRPSGTIYYRITGYRDADRRTVQIETTPWVGVATAPGAAFGFAKNADVEADETPLIFAYTPTSNGSDLEIEYNPLNPISTVQLHGIDYNVALRAPEERGLEVEVPIVIEHLSCQSISFSDGVDLMKGQKAMGPDAFNTVRSLEASERFMLNLPGGSQRFVFVDVGSLNVTTAAGLYIGELTITDATLPEVNPWDESNG